MPYTDLHQLERRIADYFEIIEQPCEPSYQHPESDDPDAIMRRVTPGDPPTLSGLVLYLGYDSRARFEKLARGKTKIAPALRRARMRIEMAYEKNLHKSSPAGAIFALKSMGWMDGKDKQARTEKVGTALIVEAKLTGPPTAATEREVVMEMENGAGTAPAPQPENPVHIKPVRGAPTLRRYQPSLPDAGRSFRYSERYSSSIEGIDDQ